MSGKGQRRQGFALIMHVFHYSGRRKNLDRKLSHPLLRAEFEQVLVFKDDRPIPDYLGECPQGHSRERSPYGDGMQLVIKSLMHDLGLMLFRQFLTYLISHSYFYFVQVSFSFVSRVFHN
jgi:hypothetical protein